MTAVSLGDLAQSFLLRRQNTAVKVEMQRLSTESVTGHVTDIAAKVSGDLVPLSGIDASLARLSSYNAVTTESALYMTSIQTSLDTIATTSTKLRGSLLATTAGSMPSTINLAGSEARQTLEAVLSALNTRVGDRSVFAGTETTDAAVIDSETMMTALDAVVAGATSAADVETAVIAWFDSPTGFSAVAYQGGATLEPLKVAPGEQVKIDVTANDPAIRDTLKGLAMAALLDRGILSGQTVGRQDLARRAGVRLLETETDRVNLAARMGSVEARISDAQTRNTAEKTSLEIARNSIVSVDPYETVSKLNDAEAQLEKIYAITARMTKLSLMDYL